MAELKGNKYGTHRVIEPKGVLTQAAWKVDNDMSKVYSNEIVCDVTSLNIDSASFTQISEACGGDEKKIGEMIMGIVAERGKQQNPVTGSGGMFKGVVAHVGEDLKNKPGFDLKEGDKIVSLVSLSMTPLKIEKILAIHKDIDRVDIVGKAILFESALYAKMPEDMSEPLALAALDVAGAPAQARKLPHEGDSVLILGANGKSGVLCGWEAMKKVGPNGKVVGVAPVGCSVFAYDYFNCDMYEAAHGRAPAVATGAKRVVGKDTLVFTYQGDGDLASIGTAEIVHAAHRGEKISTIFVNNAIYGMTGGQMAPTTLVGQKTTTSPYGRDEDWCGAPLKVSEMLAEVPCSYYIERVAVNNTPNIVKAKKAISKAFHYQMEGKGFTMVEVLSACPTNWGLSPIKAMEWLEENMIPYYPLGVKKDKGAE